MRCSKCGSDNREGRRFCGSCGSKLGTVCPQCSAANEAGENFCGDCGATILGSEPKASTAAPRDNGFRLKEPIPSPEAVDGERKTVTALFADIKGSMELMEDLDPEEARGIVDPALKLMIEAVRRYDGYVVQSTGDGIFALFGAPVAHEDHQQRALYAALRMQEDIRRYGDRMRTQGQSPLQVRIGVNTGEVVVRPIQTGAGHTEYTPIGHSTSLAARLQTIATPGSTIISGYTRRFVEGYFQLKGLGHTRVKGVSEPVELFEVTGLGPLRTRLQAAARRGLTKFVGREAELGQMRQALDTARAGHGQILAVTGEAGVGKSRLFFEFKAVAEAECLVLEAYSVSHGKASAYLPVMELLREYFEIASDDDDRKRRERLLGKVLGLDRALEDTLPYLYSLLGVSEPADAPVEMDPQIRRRRTQEAIKRILLRESLNQPLIVIFEDLHWIDAETQALLNHLVDAIANARILLLVNYRPEYLHEWGSRTHYIQLRLDPLGRHSAAEMLAALLGDEAELEPLKRLIADKTEGNPFFVEEMVQTLSEQGVIVRNGRVKLRQPLATIKVPPTVEAVLASRIDRLPPGEKELLQILAVTGREFTFPLIRRVATNDEPELQRMLGDLQSGEFIYEQPAFPDPEYSFKHALTHEVAYNSLLSERRKLLHERAAVAMESLYVDRFDDHLSELAHHYRNSANIEKAVTYLHLAGQQAAQRSAYNESVGHFTAGLEILKALPEGKERARQELALHIALAQSLGITHGLGRPEAGGALLRARELCEALGDGTGYFTVGVGLMTHYSMQLRLRAAVELGEELCGLAEGRTESLRPIHGELGMNLMLMGDFAAARAHFETLFAGRDVSERDLIGPFNESNPYPFFATLALWALGYSDKAREWNRRALAAAEKLSQPALLALAHSLTAMFHMFLLDSGMTQKHAEAAIATASEYAIPFALGLATIIRGWALGVQGRLEEGISDMTRAIASAEAAGYARRPRWFPFLAELVARSSGPAEALKILSGGLALLGNTEERFSEAELHRVHGELLLMQDPSNAGQAESCFQRAIEAARRQSAKSLELRATASFARLLDLTGRRDEARAMLAEIYNWFTEGFDTADLKDAKALLDELSR
jgi:class 3 adenylate cyclase/tetratricopeptide (TPR) repeat protein